MEPNSPYTHTNQQTNTCVINKDDYDYFMEQRISTQYCTVCLRKPINKIACWLYHFVLSNGRAVWPINSKFFDLLRAHLFAAHQTLVQRMIVAVDVDTANGVLYILHIYSCI